MKYVETESVWNACMEAIDELDFSKIHIPYEENCETGKISQRQLWQMEKEAKIVNSHIFIRMTRYFYLWEKITNKDYSRQRMLCSAIHNYIGNLYYFSPKKEIIKRVIEKGMELRIEKCDDVLESKYLQGMTNAIHAGYKKVSNVDDNQDTLIRTIIEEKAYNQKNFILDGHLCVFNTKGDIVRIPEYFFVNTKINGIILLQDEPRVIVERILRKIGGSLDE